MLFIARSRGTFVNSEVTSSEMRTSLSWIFLSERHLYNSKLFAMLLAQGYWILCLVNMNANE